MAGFILPTFNVEYNWWNPSKVSTDPYDIRGMCQPFYLSKAPFFGGIVGPWVEILVPVDWWQTGWAADTVDGLWGIADNYGNIWYYKQLWWDYFHWGFANQYITVLARQ